MPNPNADEFVRHAEEIYESRLQSILEPAHVDDFVAIEPVSGDYFLGKTLSDAARSARKAHLDRPTHVMCIGHSAALHFGLHVR